METQVKNTDFISGKWYDEQYRTPHTRYFNAYADISRFPKWAHETNRYYVDLVIMALGLDKGATILEVGCGVGNMMRAWEYRGFDIKGLEVSSKAIEFSKKDNIICGTALDIPFDDKSFDVVYTSALFEHMDVSVERKVFAECSRVGKRQAHYISYKKGGDPSHINIKSAKEWLTFFTMNTPERVFMVPDIMLNGETPLTIIMPSELLTRISTDYLVESLK